MTYQPPAERFAAAAADGRLELPVCRACGTVQWPLREVCGACLSTDLTWQPVASKGRVIASSTLHHSLDPEFRRRLPMQVLTVRLDAGPIVFAHCADTLDAGKAVSVSARLDHMGRGVFVAKKEP